MISSFKGKNGNHESYDQGDTRQFIIFTIDNQDYGIDVLNSKEIIMVNDLTMIPEAPFFIKGVIDLRGEIVPIIDIAKCFNINSKERDGARKVIIISINNVLIGIEVSEVREIIRINQEDIAEVPDITKKINKNYIEGVAKQEGKILILLDIKQILTSEEIDKIENLALQ
jgi:purine-binding chemotaxis protein CheW